VVACQPRRPVSGFWDLAAERFERDLLGLGATTTAGVQVVDRGQLRGGLRALFSKPCSVSS
jgi:hypothetical protein